MTQARRPVFRRRHRLTRALEFKAVFDAKLKAPRGPITVFVRPNGLEHPRLGLSVGRRVGGAVERNAVKRRLREAFRHLAAEWPDARPGLDVVIAAHAHPLRTSPDYAELIAGGLDRLTRLLERRREGGA
jgi:ribonuclease P protein component